MGFVKTADELAEVFSVGEGTFYDSEMLVVKWETRPEVAAMLLPPPLKLAPMCIATAYLASFPRTNIGDHLPAYREAALSLRAELEGVEAEYYLAMPVTNDMAMILGREIYGFPKKIAEVEFSRRGAEAGGWAQRRGVRYFELHASLSGRFNTPDALAAFGSDSGRYYNYKYFQAPSREGLDYPPRLVLGSITRQQGTTEPGEAEVVLRPSPYDPWSEVEVVRVLGAAYVRGTTILGDGRIVAEANPVAFLPYSLQKVD